MLFLCGYLAPDGTFYECEPYEHLDLAKSLASKIQGNEQSSGVQAEKALLGLGFVEFKSRDCLFCFFGEQPKNLTEEQRDFIRENIDKANNDDQLKEIENLLKWDEDIREDLYLSVMENHFLQKQI